VQEAKAASALNHPNILTVYEIGHFESSRFIAAELVKGKTLHEITR
jgi:serine/threonine protein kinase